jgi:pilus assembly protein CpaF
MYQVQVTTAKGTMIANEMVSIESFAFGRTSGNNIILHGWQIAQQHARLSLEGSDVFVEDLGSSSGTLVNGQKVQRFGPLGNADLIEIQGYQIRIKPPANRSLVGIGSGDAQLPSTKAAVRETVATATLPVHSGENRAASAVATSPVPTAQPSSGHGAVDAFADVDENTVRLNTLSLDWCKRLHKSMLMQMDLRRVAVNKMSHDKLREITDEMVAQIIASTADFPAELSRDAIKKRLVDEAVGLGPLEELIADEDISEIMVNASDEIYFEKKGRLQKSIVTFTDDQAVIAAIERIVTPLGRRIDESSPMVDARLRDGSRVNAIIPPLALKGPCITIRKFMKERLTPQRLIGFGSLNEAMVVILRTAVLAKRNVVISGGTGSGKTTLLNMLSSFIPMHERVVTVEDAAELQLPQPNLVGLEARPANQEGRGEVKIRDLVRNCLRMRPDRIVVGECRGGEALDMLQAMNTGHDGSLTTAHANSPRDCISRLEVMVMMAGMDLPSIAIREQIASAVNMIVQQTRFSCGQRKITSISEVTGVEGGRVQLAEIFRFQQTGYDENGRVQGRFEPTGLVPEFYEKMRARGEHIDLSIFDRPE